VIDPVGTILSNLWLWVTWPNERSKVKVKDVKLPKSFFGGNSAAMVPFTSSTDCSIPIPRGREGGYAFFLCLALPFRCCI